jgi:hypothetical protein
MPSSTLRVSASIVRFITSAWLLPMRAAGLNLWQQTPEGGGGGGTAGGGAQLGDSFCSQVAGVEQPSAQKSPEGRISKPALHA